MASLETRVEAGAEPGQQSVEHQAVAQIRNLLHRTFKVTLDDGRVFEGEFQCLDKQGNLILGRAVERMGGTSEDRQVGMVLVPRAHCKDVSVQILSSEREALMCLV
mmetsp:Transcript_11492/g.20355  ORF Transcript_11492/g.20355 Transcript_11492/m.20355 type:complete len:106 (-) Transcript_11492:522-839(-)